MSDDYCLKGHKGNNINKFGLCEKCQDEINDKMYALQTLVSKGLLTMEEFKRECMDKVGLIYYWPRNNNSR